MGRGIKKISENVIADKRSLILTTGGIESISAGLQDTYDKLPDGLVNTEAMPLGMLQADFVNRGLLMKVEQGSKDNVSTWSKLDAQFSLIQQSVTTPLIRDAAITTPKIANDNVTTEKIGTGQVQTRNIANLNVTEEKIRDSAVTTGKIHNNHVTEPKLSGDAVSTRTIRNMAVTTEKINDGAVTTGKIYDQNVTTPKIRDYAVTNIKLATDSVTNDKIVNKTINGLNKIQNRSIESININVNGVARDNLQDACINTQKIEDLSVTNAKIANETIVGSDKIVRNSITRDRLNASLIDELDRAVLHDGNGNITGNGTDGSTVLNNIRANGDIYAHRVYNVVYMDIAEGYIPGEKLEAGDIVAMHEDGKVYKATSINDCIVGVVSDEYANCFGASEKEILAGEKVAVGMIGKIHVKVKGPVRLGQRVSIAPFDAGVGCANWMNNNNIGQVLETIDCGYDEIHTVLVQVRPM
jgi:hypothetical protein